MKQIFLLLMFIFAVDAYSYPGQTPTFKDVAVTGSGTYVYLGDRSTNGSWRFTQNGTTVRAEKRIAGVWTDQGDLLATGGTPTYTVEAKAANFNAVNGYIYITTGSGITATLPAPSTGVMITIKKTDSNVVTVAPNGSELIDGNSGNYSIGNTKQSITLVSDGTNWFLI